MKCKVTVLGDNFMTEVLSNCKALRVDVRRIETKVRISSELNCNSLDKNCLCETDNRR